MINKLVEKIKKTGAPIVVGLDPMLNYIPQHVQDKAFAEYGETLEGAAEAIWQFNKEIVDKTYDLIPAVKPQIAMYEQFGVPGVMASRTIENDRDRKMTIMTTTFVPCGAKLPIIALIAGALFGNSGWVAFSAYVLGVLAIIVSGIMLKKFKMFAGEPAPFVMELPAYHAPTAVNVLRSMWERG